MVGVLVAVGKNVPGGKGVEVCEAVAVAVAVLVGDGVTVSVAVGEGVSVGRKVGVALSATWPTGVLVGKILVGVTIGVTRVELPPRSGSVPPSTVPMMKRINIKRKREAAQPIPSAPL
jgi:hypothetical protein